MGDCLNESSTGGVIRLFGDALSLGSTEQVQHHPEGTQQLRRAAAAALAAQDWATLSRVSAQLQTRQEAAGPGTTPSTRLQLTPVRGSGANLTLSAERSSLTQYHASFTLPAGTLPGEYTMHAKNELSETWAAIWVGKNTALIKQRVYLFIYEIRGVTSSVLFANPDRDRLL